MLTHYNFNNIGIYVVGKLTIKARNGFNQPPRGQNNTIDSPYSKYLEAIAKYKLLYDFEVSSLAHKQAHALTLRK
ncbi:MAG: hypothetical protein EAZ33_09585 [Oscillatoriales cyanobacterium]|nr:MAG: hypothetical protein EAZ33_09585 [Oscillatoriales cyanobacterium]